METITTFSLRLEATAPLESVKQEVERALGGCLEGGTFLNESALIGDVLGMQVVLMDWHGIDGKGVDQLHGLPHQEALRLGSWEDIPIDRAVIDLLYRRGAGRWTIPSRDELKSEGRSLS